MTSNIANNNVLNNQQIKQIFDLVIEASEIAITGFYEKNFVVKNKPDNSKVTSIDLEISQFIALGLKKILPNIPVICEEGFKGEGENKGQNEDENNSKNNCFFLVDPIDGTASFINSKNEFSINIALIKNNHPVFGMIYAPLFQGGRMVFSDEKKQVWLYQNDLNFEQVINHPLSRPSQARIIASHGIADKKIDDFMKKNYGDYHNFKVEKYSSAVKFIILLTNQADLYLHLKTSMEWDTAAGQALVEMLGGEMREIDLNIEDCQILNNLAYDKKNYINPNFLASFLK